MTLFTLQNSNTNKRNMLIYLGVSLFCIVFGYVYECFGHGIVSYFMYFGFVIPLILGFLYYLLTYLLKCNKMPSIFSSYLYNAGVATLTVGSYFKGVIEIYGTTRDIYVIIFFSVGFILITIGIISYIIALIMNKTKNQPNI